MLGWDIYAIAEKENLARLKGYSVFDHQNKINAIVNNAITLAAWTEDQFFAFLADARKVATDDQKSWAPLTQFSYISGVTKFHLARNLGLDFTKPDLHLERVAAFFGFQSAHDMVDLIAGMSGHRPGVIDHVIWRYASETGEPRETN